MELVKRRAGVVPSRDGPLRAPRSANRSACATRATSRPELELRVSTVSSISEVDRDAWNACAYADGETNPFVSWEFLHALEESGSVGRRAGWLPIHCILTGSSENEIVGVVPLYLKSHSYGEYVFDHSWASAYTRLTGRDYYPKLQSCVPFSPVTGARLLAKAGPHREAMLEALASSLVTIADELKVSSLHVTFNKAEETGALSGDAGFLTRTGIQYWWENRGYESFDDFLANLKQSKRKSIRQERKSAAKADLTVRRTLARDMGRRDWDAFYRFYRNTCDKKWGQAYLNRTFFDVLGELMPEQVMMVGVEDSKGEPVAGALNLVGGDALYGRNWGCKHNLHVKNLHFECCYYQAIEAAIEMGLSRVEAGAQGEHKIKRGYLPSLTYSAHYVKDPKMRSIVSEFLRQERAEIDYAMEVLNQEMSPYKDANAAPPSP